MVRNVNYRAAVEGIFIRNNRVFIAKRADNCVVAPGIWNVPAGKVKFEEIPDAAIVREMIEETEINISKLPYKRIKERAFRGTDSRGEETYRLVFSYVIDLSGTEIEPKLDEEHSTGKWITKEELSDSEFSRMNEQLRIILFESLDG